MTNKTLIIGLASNQNAIANFEAASNALRTLFGNVTFSTPQTTKDIAGDGKPDYLNAVAVTQSTLCPEIIKAKLLAIEKSMGRDRTTPEIVTIDLDILALGQEIDPVLEIPSIELTRRDFFLFPAAEIVPDFIHPMFNHKLSFLAQRKKERLAKSEQENNQ